MVFTELETTATIVKAILNKKKVKFSFVSSGFTSEKNLKSVSDFHDKTTIILNHGIIEGMSLKNCNNVILAEAPSSPEIYAQAISRVRRHDSHISVPSYVNSYLLVSTISKTTMNQKKNFIRNRSGSIRFNYYVEYCCRSGFHSRSYEKGNCFGFNCCIPALCTARHVPLLAKEAARSS